MKKQYITRTLGAISLSLLLGLTGCGGPAPSSSGSTPSHSSEDSTPVSSIAESSDSSLSGEDSLLISEEPLTLTAHIHNGPTEVLSDDWTIEKEAGRLTNIYLKGTASVNETDAVNAFNLMIASKDLPDIVGGPHRVDLMKYGMEGAFIPLNDLIDEHAPNIRKMLDENPDVEAAITAEDGNIYLIPTLEDSQMSQAWFIRKDWLDKLGLEIPETVDELHDTLLAFVNEDPNGNGQKDEVCFFNRNGGFGQDLGGSHSALFSLFGVNLKFHTNSDGKVELGAYTPEMKEAMKNVSQWCNDGLIDPELFTRGGNARDILFSANNGGLTHDWYPSCSAYNDKMSGTVPGFELVGMLPPVDINGDQWEQESRAKVTDMGTAISVQNEHPEESIKYLDFWWSEIGSRLMTYGIEGEHHTMEDGKPVFTDKVMNANEPINNYMKALGGQQYQIGHVNLSEYENFMMSQDGVDVVAQYKKEGVVDKMNVNLPALSLTAGETEIIQSKWPVISTYIQEQIQKWTFDGSNIDAEFDKYMNDIKGMGIEDVLAAYQAAYDRSL